MKANVISRRQFVKHTCLAMPALVLSAPLNAFKPSLTMKNQKAFDVIIIGGSFAGLSAAMTLGRSLRSVLVIDSGQPCNRFTPHAHNLITHDGKAPGSIKSEAEAQVLAYPTISILNDLATEMTGESGAFTVTTRQEHQFQTKKVIFATGVKDLLPAIEGVEDCWGKTILHCPYCHGYEVRGKRTGIWVNDDTVYDFYKLIAHWTDDLTILTNGQPQFEVDQLPTSKVQIIDSKIQKLDHQNGALQNVVFENGKTHNLDAVYFRPPFEQHCKIPETLGCKTTEAGHLEVTNFQQTSIHGIYAAGDCTTPMRSLAIAISQGNLAAAMLNHELINEAA